MHKKPRILGTRTLAHTRMFRIQGVDLEFGNGVQVEYERLLGSSQGAVLIIPMRDDETVLLVREYAAGTERYELGLPKGRIEPGETALDAADREMKEEIGFGARRLDPLYSMTVAPGFLSHQTHLVLARDLYPCKLEGDEPEEIEVVPWRLSDMAALLAREDFSEARSIAALFLTREFLAHD